jgi:hypothetical protein
LIVVIYKLSTWNVPVHEKYMTGFWTCDADDDFAIAAGIQSMMLYIGEPSYSWARAERICYLIIMDDICNQGLTLAYSTGWATPIVAPYKISCRAAFDDEQIWPADCTFEIDMLKGAIIVKSGDTIHAKLNKQHDITNMTSN